MKRSEAAHSQLNRGLILGLSLGVAFVSACAIFGIHELLTAHPQNLSVRFKQSGLVVLAAFIISFAGVLILSLKLDALFSKCSQEINRATDERTEAQQALSELKVVYNSLVENLPAGIFRKDKEGRFVFVNSMFCGLKGLPSEKLLGKMPDALVNQALDQLGLQSHELVRLAELGTQGVDHHNLILQTGQPIRSEEEYSGKDGKTVYVEALKCPVFGADGSMIGTQGFLFDVTARKAAEKDLAFERELLTNLLDNSPDAIYFKDCQSRFIKCSKGFERYGRTPEQLIGMTDFDLFKNEHSLEAFTDEQEIIRTGKPMVDKVEHELWVDGQETWGLTSKMPTRNQKGEIIGTFGVTKDITAMKKAEVKLEQVHRELLRTSRMAGMAEVATSVLHNVGNVLNSVNISSSLISEKVRKSKVINLSKAAELIKGQKENLSRFLADDPKGKQLPEYLCNLSTHLASEQEEILAELVSLTSNIEHIKEIVTMQQSYARVSGALESLQVTELVEDAMRLNTGAMERHHIKVVRDYQLKKEVMVDKHKVLQILVNLIRNAKYALDEGAAVEKIMTLRVSNGEPGKIKISIIDNGVGISQENLTRIFGHGFTTRKEGHGFGLHSGALGAKELGGSLLAESAGLGKGAKFTLELPYEPAKEFKS